MISYFVYNINKMSMCYEYILNFVDKHKESKGVVTIDTFYNFYEYILLGKNREEFANFLLLYPKLITTVSNKFRIMDDRIDELQSSTQLKYEAGRVEYDFKYHIDGILCIEKWSEVDKMAKNLRSIKRRYISNQITQCGIITDIAKIISRYTVEYY